MSLNLTLTNNQYFFFFIINEIHKTGTKSQIKHEKLNIIRAICNIEYF